MTGQRLLILDNIAAVASQTVVPVVGATSDIATAPVLHHGTVWGNYAIVSNEERRRMGCSVRDILVEQVQTAPRHVWNPITNDAPNYDIRFSHAIKALFFAVRNTTFSNQPSNYTTASPVITSTTVILEPSTGAFDPIHHTTLIYENTNRLNHMGSDTFRWLIHGIMRLQFLDLPGSMNIHIHLPLTKLILWEVPIMVTY